MKAHPIINYFAIASIISIVYYLFTFLIPTWLLQIMIWSVCIRNVGITPTLFFILLICKYFINSNAVTIFQIQSIFILVTYMCHNRLTKTLLICAGFTLILFDHGILLFGLMQVIVCNLTPNTPIELRSAHLLFQTLSMTIFGLPIVEIVALTPIYTDFVKMKFK